MRGIEEHGVSLDLERICDITWSISTFEGQEALGSCNAGLAPKMKQNKRIGFMIAGTRGQ